MIPFERRLERLEQALAPSRVLFVLQDLGETTAETLRRYNLGNDSPNIIVSIRRFGSPLSEAERAHAVTGIMPEIRRADWRRAAAAPTGPC